jgi:hypothetical protein
MEQDSSIDHLTGTHVIDIALAREHYVWADVVTERRRFDNAVNYEVFVQMDEAISAYLGAPKRHIVRANLLGKLTADTSATERLVELQQLPVCHESFEMRLSAIAHYVQQYLPAAAREVVPELGTVCIASAHAEAR